MTAATTTPMPAVGRPFVAGTAFDLAEVGYGAGEYVLAATAVAYGRGGEAAGVVEEAPFATRILVYRPLDDAAFNGTVWVEWLNVSGGLDAAPDWLFTHTELVRAGAAWMGVSAQRTGVEGGAGLLGLPSLGLVAVDPRRYGELRHPGDRFSYDIYAQAGAVARRGSGTILDGLAVERVLAIGESQSAFRLTTFVNEIDPLTPVFDGCLVHARGRGAAPLDDEGPPMAGRDGEPTPFRPDLRIPVLCVESETDLLALGYLAARQDDAEHLAVWEMAGTSHADVYTFAVGPIDTGRLGLDALAGAWVPPSEVYGMALERPVNAGAQHYVMNAAVRALERWVAGGGRPPEAPRLAVDGGALVLDEHGNARGGIRTPPVDVPTAVLSGLGNGGHPIAMLCGTTTAFEADTLSALYRSRRHYRERFEAATALAVDGGFVLAEDGATLTAVAEANCPL